MTQKIAVFDIDGTIFRKNLAFELINELAWMKVFKKEVRKTLTDLYSRWLDHEGTYEEYRKALVAIYFENLKGCRQEQILKASKLVVPFYKNRTYIFAIQLIEKLRREDYNIIAVSGSPSEIVEEYNKYLKFDAVFGSVYEIDSEGFYTGKAIFEPTIHKGHVVRQYVTENNLNFKGSYGIGDTESDVKFLEIVENPIAFNPNSNLHAIAKKRGWRIVVEKKDVIYDIK
ncbi:MAG TPA: HAD family phosphatase [Candidatus Moranbacteria bacterium]|mgnify:CR=1 FL=1|nr:HAD family phosphatase [Candidatus Moranbacteria bacterium]